MAKRGYSSKGKKTTKTKPKPKKEKLASPPPLPEIDDMGFLEEVVDEKVSEKKPEKVEKVEEPPIPKVSKDSVEASATDFLGESKESPTTSMDEPFLEPEPQKEKKRGFFSKLFKKKEQPEPPYTELAEGPFAEDKTKSEEDKPDPFVEEKEVPEEDKPLPAPEKPSKSPPTKETDKVLEEELFSDEERQLSRIEQEKKLLDKIKKKNSKEVSLRKEQLDSLEKEIQLIGRQVIAEKKKVSSELKKAKETRKQIEAIKKDMEKRGLALHAKEAELKRQSLNFKKEKEEAEKHKQDLERREELLKRKRKQFEEEIGFTLKKKELEEKVTYLESVIKTLKKTYLDNTTKVEATTKHDIEGLVAMAKSFIKIQQYEKAKEIYNLIEHLFASVSFHIEEGQEIKLTIKQLYNDINLGLINKE